MKYSDLKKSYITKSDCEFCRIKNYISAANYSEDMINKVEPVLNSLKKSGYIIGTNNLELYYEKFIVDNPKGNIVISHGIGEYTEKYNELIYYFINASYSVFIIEHRGNGRSGRLGKDIGQISVEKFDNYIEDFKQFIEEKVIPNSYNKKIILFAHSMGGGIGTVFLEKYPQYFNGAILSSPMHQINTGNTPAFIADMLSRIWVCFGKGNEYMPGQKSYNGQRRFPSRSTNCEERYNYQYDKILKNKSFQTGGASAKWYFEASKATRYIRNKKNISKVKIPVILLQAECDTHVIADAHYKFAKYADNCEVIIVANGKHETYFEVDEITIQVIYKIMNFIESI